MSSSKIVSYYYDEEIGNFHYDLGHPMKPHRMRMTHDLVTGYGLHNHMKVYQPRKATDAEMTMYHSDEYIDLLKSINFNGINSHMSIPLFFKTSASDINHINCHIEDCPTFDGVYDFSAKCAGASLAGANHLNQGKSDVVINWMGGLHHAKSTTASGFCYVNDIVLAILRLLEVHPRVMYIDIDVHHGDGVEEAFYTTDRVMTVSFHKFGAFFPCTGHLGDTGMDRGRGYSVNIPLDYGINDDQYVRLFQKTISYLLEWYRPGAIVLQCGADSLAQDRLGCFNLSGKGHSACVDFIMKQNLPTMLLGGGGYTIRNVARAWTMETGVALGIELSDELPQSEFINYYAPEYRLNVDCTNMDNANTERSLDALYEQMVDNLRNLALAPSVQSRPIPTNNLRDEDEIDVEDNPDVRFTQSFRDTHRSRQGEYARETDAHNAHGNSTLRKGSNSTLHESPTHAPDSSIPHQPPRELPRKMSKVATSGLLWNKSISQVHVKSDHEESDDEFPLRDNNDANHDDEASPSEPVYSTTVFPTMPWEKIPSCPRLYPDPSPPASHISVSDHEHALSEDEHHHSNSRRDSASFDLGKLQPRQDSASDEDEASDLDLSSSVNDGVSSLASSPSPSGMSPQRLLDAQMAELHSLALTDTPSFSFDALHATNGSYYTESPLFRKFKESSLTLIEEPVLPDQKLLTISEGDERASGTKREADSEGNVSEASNKNARTDVKSEEVSNEIQNHHHLDVQRHNDLIFEESSRDESGLLDHLKLGDDKMDVDEPEETTNQKDDEDTAMEVDEEPAPVESTEDTAETKLEATVNGRQEDQETEKLAKVISPNPDSAKEAQPTNEKPAEEIDESNPTEEVEAKIEQSPVSEAVKPDEVKVKPDPETANSDEVSAKPKLDETADQALKDDGTNDQTNGEVVNQTSDLTPKSDEKDISSPVEPKNIEKIESESNITAPEVKDVNDEKDPEPQDKVSPEPIEEASEELPIDKEKEILSENENAQDSQDSQVKVPKSADESPKPQEPTLSKTPEDKET